MLLDIDWHRVKPYYSYSSSNAMWSQIEYKRAYRSRADHLEALVKAAVSNFLGDRKRLRSALKSHGIFGDELEDC